MATKKQIISVKEEILDSVKKIFKELSKLERNDKQQIIKDDIEEIEICLALILKKEELELN